MKRLTVAMIFAALMLAALPASAHAWSGVGDCDGWTLTLDGLWGAQRIEVDGVDYGRQTTITIPDTSGATSRTFSVRWVKQGPDTVQSRTITRPGGCTPTTTSSTTTTTEAPTSTTSTTLGITTTSTPSTSTTEPEGTTTTTSTPSTMVPPSSTTSTTPGLSPTSTNPAPTTTAPTPPSTIPPEGSATSTTPLPTIVTTEPTRDTLPRTGVGVDSALVAAVAALVAGGGLVALTRDEK